MFKFLPIVVLCLVAVSTNVLLAQEAVEIRSAPDSRVLGDEQWKQLDDSVQKGLQWLATQQEEDGSFKTLDSGQPAVTSFCLMAFLAQGESPADGKYQKQLAKAIDFIIKQQKANGLIATTAPNEVPIPRDVEHANIGQTSAYNHAISSLALCEAYGQCKPEQAKKLAPVIEKAIETTLTMQRWGGKTAKDEGGWRYLGVPWPNNDSDLSITGWQLMFLRSAKNSGFDVPQKSIDAAVTYVGHCFLTDKNRQVHSYKTGPNAEIACTRAMAGAGVLALAHAGKHESKEAVASGEWILKHDFSKYNDDTPVFNSAWFADRYHYGAVLCTQAMYQLGGKYWEKFFPTLVKALLANQKADGSWPPEKKEKQYGNCYSTALCILSLSVPNQMLPIFQR